MENKKKTPLKKSTISPVHPSDFNLKMVTLNDEIIPTDDIDWDTLNLKEGEDNSLIQDDQEFSDDENDDYMCYNDIQSLKDITYLAPPKIEPPYYV